MGDQAIVQQLCGELDRLATLVQGESPFIASRIRSIATQLAEQAPALDPAPAFGQSYRCARCSDLMPKPPEPHLYCVKCSRADADRLDDLETNCWGLKAFAITDTDGDEFGWRVVQQRTHGGRDVVIATEHSDDLRAAIDAASGIDRGDSYHG